MAHRIYIYNVDLKDKAEFPTLLAEWNYVLPVLLTPLFAVGIRTKGTLLYADKDAGVECLRQFYDVLEKTYQLQENTSFVVARNQLFDFLENLPYETFKIDGRDVFDMQEEKHSEQAKNWVLEIKQDMRYFEEALVMQSLAPLDEVLDRVSIRSFLDILETDWIAYGVGYWEKAAIQDKGVSIYEEGRKYGLKDRNGNTLIGATYTTFHAWNESGIALVEKDNRFGFISNLGEELVPCMYDWAVDPHEVDGKHYAEVKKGENWGVLEVETAHWALEPIYDFVRWVYEGYFTTKQDNAFQLYHIDGRCIIDESSAEPFQYDFKNLFFVQAKGSISRKYYQRNGLVFGTFMEDVLQPLANGYFWTKPNKLQKKINILKPDGQTLAANTDRIIARDGYQTIAYLDGKEWKIYSLENHVFRLEEDVISKLSLDEIGDYVVDVFVLTTARGQGIYQASAGRWLLQPEVDHQKITYCFMEFMRITTSRGMYYFDVKLEALSEGYDYICEPIHYPNASWKKGELLILFREDCLYKVDLQKQVVEISALEIPSFYADMQNLNVNDQQYFDAFYQRVINV